MSGFEALGDAAAGVVRWLTADSASLLVAWTLALTLAWSGVAKVRRPLLAALAMVNFRVISRPRSGPGRALGVAELTITGMLAGVSISSVLGTLGAVLAVITFAAFSFVLARSLLAGETFECNCFGDSHATISTGTLFRAGAFAVLAGLLAGRLVTDPPTASTAQSAATATTAAAIVGSAALLTSARQLLSSYKPLAQHPSKEAS
jgi:hypothetical protein